MLRRHAPAPDFVLEARYSSASPSGGRPHRPRRAASYGPSDAGHSCFEGLFERVVVVPPSGSVIVVGPWQDLTRLPLSVCPYGMGSRQLTLNVAELTLNLNENSSLLL